MAGDVFRASRVSRGNRLFPTQVAITPTSVVQYKPRWIGKQEQTIHMAHVASVNIDTGAVLSNVLIETSGGSDPILCHGHRKRDAIRKHSALATPRRISRSRHRMENRAYTLRIFAVSGPSF